MAERVVIDASVALARLLEERSTPTSQALLRAWTEAGNDLLVPSHFWLEVSNVLMRRRHWTAAQTVEGLMALDKLGITTIESDRTSLLLALDPMERRGLTAYDALYLALAQSMNARLGTLDRRLAQVAMDAGVVVESDPPTRLAEDSGSYDAAVPRRPSWIRSAAVGRHLAELRQGALTDSGAS
ncbi:MAG: type II toxin-antitoxin system VapC family toxin [Chloroflexota bacterium]|nr:type II toxin-antitoxin system VapC family toxin [Chloroflexota bacterium]